MNIKLSKLILTAIIPAAFLITGVNSEAMPSSTEHCDQQQASPERMHENIKARLSRLAERLEIKASQQAAWETFSKSVEALADQNTKKPNEEADAATIVRYRADRAAELAKKLGVIADATGKLQKVLEEDQRKILNQVSHHFLQKHHGWHGKHHWMGSEGHE